jgi:hypothetical protein
MTSTTFRILALAIALAAGTAYGSDDDSRSHRERDARAAHADAARGAFQTVPNAAAPGEPAFGWQYFADAAGRRAVVISPEGTYYFSRGKGLRAVAETGAQQTAAATDPGSRG